MRLKELIAWLNANEGFLGLILFLASLLIAWISGILRALVRKPKFKIRVIPKLTFCSVYYTEKQYTPPRQDTYDLHKTCFVVYLQITNIGSAASELGKIKIGYYRNNGKSTLFQKRLWIKESTILDDFGIPIADGQIVKINHLRQASPFIDNSKNNFLEVSKSAIGAAYFEQVESWGNHNPRQDDNWSTEIKIKVEDAFGNVYSTKVKVPIKSIEEAHRYNPKFGFSERLIDKEIHDLSADEPKSEVGGKK
jgi:hypothetical protein